MKYTLTLLAFFASFAASAQTIDNWVSSNGEPVRSANGSCWRNGYWTPATAHPDCDKDLQKKSAIVAVNDKVDITKPTATIAARVGTSNEVIKTSYQADTFFDFDKSVIKPEGKVILGKLLEKIKDVTLEVAIVIGHTDSTGTEAYNQKLGLRRANAVKAYLVSKGVEANRVYVESYGELKPIASNKTKEGRAKNRRVEIEVIGATVSK